MQKGAWGKGGSLDEQGSCNLGHWTREQELDCDLGQGIGVQEGMQGFEL